MYLDPHQDLLYGPPEPDGCARSNHTNLTRIFNIMSELDYAEGRL